VAEISVLLETSFHPAASQALERARPATAMPKPKIPLARGNFSILEATPA
jgi:hypothetical protein